MGTCSGRQTSFLTLGMPLGIEGAENAVATEPLRAAADAVSGRVAAAMTGQLGAEVVELPKRKDGNTTPKY